MLSAWSQTTNAGLVGLGAVSFPVDRPMMLSGFTGAPDTLRAMVEAAQGPRGEKSLVVRSMVEQIVQGLQPKDYVGEILAIRNWVAEYVRYVNDPQHVELVKDPQALVEEYLRDGVAHGDCDCMACCIGSMHLCLGRDAQFLPVGFGQPGHYSHVFERCMEPRTKTWIICDPVAGTREREMASRITTYQIWSLDELPDHGPVEER
jgi:hypothetical protein